MSEPEPVMWTDCEDEACRKCAAIREGDNLMDAPEVAGSFCSECLSLMVDDDGAGHLCPVCDEHSPSDCGNDFPCSGIDGAPCALNAPLGDRTIMRDFGSRWTETR